MQFRQHANNNPFSKQINELNNDNLKNKILKCLIKVCACVCLCVYFFKENITAPI